MYLKKRILNGRNLSKEKRGPKVINQHELVTIQLTDLKEKITPLKEKGYRLVQICCTKTQGYELIYSFDLNLSLLSYKIMLDDNSTVLSSISDIFPGSFLYENEIHDLFGFTVKGMSIDYQGNFYRTQVKHAFSMGPSITVKKEG